MSSILVVDDDERLLDLVVALLRLNSYDVKGATSAAAARTLIFKNHFDAIIVDWMMPNESGIDFITSIRNSPENTQDIPAIMLTALNDIDNKVQGFESGFDDYLTKPFEEQELILRLNALLKRSSSYDKATDIIKFGDCKFNTKTNTLTKGIEIIHLSTTELTLLKTLCQRPNQPFSREELSKKLSFQVSDRTIDVQITRLRKKIGDDTKEPKTIKTVRYVGYSICCEAI